VPSNPMVPKPHRQCWPAPASCATNSRWYLVASPAEALRNVLIDGDVKAVIPRWPVSPQTRPVAAQAGRGSGPRATPAHTVDQCAGGAPHEQAARDRQQPDATGGHERVEPPLEHTPSRWPARPAVCALTPPDPR